MVAIDILKGNNTMSSNPNSSSSRKSESHIPYPDHNIHSSPQDPLLSTPSAHSQHSDHHTLPSPTRSSSSSSEPIYSSTLKKHHRPHHRSNQQQSASLLSTGVSSLFECVYSGVESCYNRLTAWFFPNEPEPLDLTSTIFFVAQVPFLFLVFLTWIPTFVGWLTGWRVSEAGDRGKGQGMRKTWSLRLALSLSFLKVYLRHADMLTIEECQGRSRSIPFMTAPAGIRVKKVKIPAFPFRNRAESIVYEHLTEQERAWLHWKKDVEDTWHGLPSQEQDGSNSVNAQLETATELNSLYFGASSSERLQEKKSHYKDDQFAEGLDAEWLEYIGPAETDADRIEMTSENMAAVLYFHGGGYYTGSKEEHRVLIGPLVRRLGKHVRILTINYRLAPQHPFPAALVDALSCYMWLLDQSISEAFGLKTPIPTQQRPTDNFQPHQVIFMGDSAGGGLALSLSLLLRDHASPAIPQPNKIVTWSPWLDLTQALPSFKENAMTDCIPYEDFTHLHSDAVDSMFRHIELPEKSQNYQEQEEQKGTNIRQRAQVYCPDTCLTMKYVSPLYETDFRGIPDVLIVCGSAERFANECILMASRLEEQQQPCRIDIHEDMPHIFPLFRFHPSSITALDRTSAFIREAVSASIYTLNSECNSSGDGRNRSDSVVIPISSPPSSISSNSSSSSSSPSRSPTPRLAMGKDLNRDRNSVVLFDGIEEGVYSQDENGALRMQDSPLGLKRTGSSSSLSSEMSSSTTGTQQQQQQQQTQRRRRSGQPVVFDPQTYSTDFASYEGDRKASKKTAVNVIDLSGSSVMSFHKRTRFGTPSDRDRALKAETEEATGLLDDGLSAGRSGIRKRRRRERLTLRDIVSDATLYEWEVLLKQGYIPTRHWPQPPTGGVSGRHGSGRRRMFIS